MGMDFLETWIKGSLGHGPFRLYRNFGSRVPVGPYGPFYEKFMAMDFLETWTQGSLGHGPLKVVNEFGSRSQLDLMDHFRKN